MSNPLSSLSEDEVRQVALLVETLDESTFDYLQLEIGNLKVTIGKGAMPATGAAAAAAAVPPAPPTPVVAPMPAAAIASDPPAPERNSIGATDGTVAISAPIIGRFYAQPQPGLPPFVALGSEIDEDTTVGLIEVMKTFNAVRAGVSGTVVEVCAQDGAMVEFGQVLFRVRPAAARGLAAASRA